MQIYGNDYDFYMSTWASGEIADLCPSGQLSDLGDFINEGLPQKQLFTRFAKIAVILNKSAIMRKNFESGLPMSKWEHTEAISEEMLLSLPVDEFIKVQSAIMTALTEGTRTSVEVEADSKNAMGEAETT